MLIYQRVSLQKNYYVMARCWKQSTNHLGWQVSEKEPPSKPPFCKISSCLKKLNALGGRRVFVLPNVMPDKKFDKHHWLNPLRLMGYWWVNQRIQDQQGHERPHLCWWIQHLSHWCKHLQLHRSPPVTPDRHWNKRIGMQCRSSQVNFIEILLRNGFGLVESISWEPYCT